MIVDAILFFNELDVLEVRLHELAPVVDAFVIVESLEPHGAPGTHDPFLGLNLNPRFEAFKDKIFYKGLASLQPPHTSRACSWPRENYHRNALLQFVQEIAHDYDTVLISDCDEIPRAATIRHHLSQLQEGVFSFRQDFFYYDVNNYLGSWHGTCGGRLRSIKSFGGAQALRDKRDQLPELSAQGGWHFSYFGGVDRIETKLASFAHAGEDTINLASCRGRESLIEDMLSGRDLYHRDGEGRREFRSADDERLPAWLRANISRYPLFTEDGLRAACKI